MTATFDERRTQSIDDSEEKRRIALLDIIPFRLSSESVACDFYEISDLTCCSIGRGIWANRIP